MNLYSKLKKELINDYKKINEYYKNKTNSNINKYIKKYLNIFTKNGIHQNIIINKKN